MAFMLPVLLLTKVETHPEGDRRRAADVSKARDRYSSAVTAEKWLSTRGPETWRAYVHERYAHFYGKELESETFAEFGGFPVSTEYFPGIMEKRWLGW